MENDNMVNKEEFVICGETISFNFVDNVPDAKTWNKTSADTNVILKILESAVEGQIIEIQFKDQKNAEKLTSRFQTQTSPHKHLVKVNRRGSNLYLTKLKRKVI